MAVERWIHIYHICCHHQVYMQTAFLSSVTKEWCKMTHLKRVPESGIHDSFFIVFVEVLSLHEKCESFISNKNWLVNEEEITLINSS